MSDRSHAGRFEGQVAFITGGASGIGEAIARRFVEEGGRVGIADIDAAALSRLQAELGSAAYITTADVTDEAAVERATYETADAFGGITVDFNVAGGAFPAHLLSYPASDWTRTLELVLTGTFYAMKHAARRMVEHGAGGAIVNISSFTGYVPNPASAAYAAAKAGVQSLTRSGALELGPHEIRVNSISPGVTDTPMIRDTLLADKGLTDALCRRIPLNRVASADEMAGPALFLASADSTYLTGADVIVDGGWLTASGFTSLPEAAPWVAKPSFPTPSPRAGAGDMGE